MREGFVSLGRGARIGAGAQLEDCVVLAGAAVAAGARRRRAVIGDGWVSDGAAPAAGARLPREEARALLALAVVRDAGFGGDAQVMAITGHGSDRRFWRLREADGRSAVLMRTEPGDAEFARFVAIARFLHTQALGGPAILAVDRERCALVMEDLGEESLYQRVRGGAAGGVAPAGGASLCERALALLVELQTRGTRAAAQCPEAGDRRFDLETLRWETDCFRRRFLAELAGLPARELGALDGDFERLAQAVHAQPTVLMHRDFQSQNIMVRDGGRLGLVDFQGMRRGPLGYDPMSLIRDAYLELEPDRQEALMAAYRERLQAASGPQLAPAAWRAMATAAGLQRTMQALGAFAYLSGVKGKLHFRRYIPCALRHLAAGLRELHEPGEPGGAVAPGPLARLEGVVARLL